MTLRQALRELGAEGLIVQRPGEGTFVAPPHLAYYLGSLRSLADDLREQGHEVRTTVIDRSLHRVPPRIAARLRVRETETGLRLEPVRAFAGRRAIHQVSWVRRHRAVPPLGSDPFALIRIRRKAIRRPRPSRRARQHCGRHRQRPPSSTPRATPNPPTTHTANSASTSAPGPCQAARSNPGSRSSRWQRRVVRPAGTTARSG